MHSKYTTKRYLVSTRDCHRYVFTYKTLPLLVKLVLSPLFQAPLICSRLPWSIPGSPSPENCESKGGFWHFLPTWVMSRQNGVGESLTAYWHTRGFRTTKWTKISSSWLQQWRRWVSHTPSTECIVGWTISSRALAGALWDTSAIVDHVTAMHSVIGNWKKKKRIARFQSFSISLLSMLQWSRRWISHTHTPSAECIVGWATCTRALAGAHYKIADHVTATCSRIENYKTLHASNPFSISLLYMLQWSRRRISHTPSAKYIFGWTTKYHVVC